MIEHYGQVQAVYLFGTWGTAHEWPQSEVDIAVLFAPLQAKQVGSMALSPARFELETLLSRDVDLVNLRQTNTVIQKEIVTTGRRIFCPDELGADEFEMVVLSLYQKLQQELQFTTCIMRACEKGP